MEDNRQTTSYDRLRNSFQNHQHQQFKNLDSKVYICVCILCNSNIFWLYSKSSSSPKSNWVAHLQRLCRRELCYARFRRCRLVSPHSKTSRGPCLYGINTHTQSHIFSIVVVVGVNLFYFIINKRHVLTGPI